MKRDSWTIALAIGGIGNVLNGAWMLVDPAGWYATIPGVPGSGPLNEHFVRDVGAMYALMGVALVLAALQPARRVVLVGVVAMFYVLHALVHVLDTTRGLFPPGQWATDAVPIYLPTLVLLGAVIALARRTPWAA
jgi:hypothetical protein